jgi:RHS repeat-associated protein
MVDAVGIIHMNGRIYDPKLGRFLQADPFIQAPYNTQSLNRYSYVMNNPLNATDPSGYFAWAAVWAVMKVAVAAYVVSDIIVTIGINSGWSSDLIGALTIATTIWLTGAIGPESLTTTEIAVMATLGGITSVLQGGKFGHGFVSAGLSAIGGQFIKGANWIKKGVGKTVAKITLGGTISKITGGKFANGAAGAAFAMVVQSVGAGLGDSQDSPSATTPDVDPNITSPGMPEGDAVAYESGGGNYSESAQKVPLPVINEVVVTVERISAGSASAPSRSGYFPVPLCGSCTLPTYPTQTASAFSMRDVNNLTIDIGKAAGNLMLNSAAAVNGVGAARAGLGYLARRPETLSAVIRVGANALDEAGFVDHSIIGATGTGLPRIQHQHVVRNPIIHTPK